MIEIYTEELPPEWAWSPSSYVGGTPEFVVETAEAVSKTTKVVVYYDGNACQWNGVNYLPRKYFQGKDIVLSCNSVAPKLGKYSILWTALYGKKDFEYLNFDERIVISPYHQSIFGSNSRIVPLGVHADKFKGGKKIKGLCLYSSSPDRGGMWLKGIWKEVERETKARLISTYNSRITEDEMVTLYKDAEFWLHPCQGIELFCISAVKAQVAGCIPVVVPNMALETTVKYGVKTTIDNYVKDLINAIKNPPKVEAVDFGSWESVTKDLFKAVL
jgi:glycosyltransferase involved in cell wall biosynthesis